MQVSMSKKWDSKPALDEDGQELRTKSGKPVLKKSYSVLQDDFFIHMRTAGYTDIERGERGSSEEHLTVTQFKVEREQERLTDLTEQTQQKEAEAAALDKKIEKTRQRKVDIESWKWVYYYQTLFEMTAFHLRQQMSLGQSFLLRQFP